MAICPIQLRNVESLSLLFREERPHLGRIEKNACVCFIKTVGLLDGILTPSTSTSCFLLTKIIHKEVNSREIR